MKRGLPQFPLDHGKQIAGRDSNMDALSTTRKDWRVYCAAAAYSVGAWALLRLEARVLEPALDLPVNAWRGLFLLLAIGLPVVVAGVWLLKVTNEAEPPGRSIARLAPLCLPVWIAFVVLGFWVGPQYDYGRYYVIDWTRVLAGDNPWNPDPTTGFVSHYGPGHQMLAVLYLVHPLAPKLLFIISWFGIFFIALSGRDGGTSIDVASVFLTLFAAPFFIVLICFYGVNDALVAFLTLLAVHLRVHKGMTIMPAALLAVATLTKLYPIALLPFLATGRGKISFRLIAAFVLAFAIGLLPAFILWGSSPLNIARPCCHRRKGRRHAVHFLLPLSKSPLADLPIAAFSAAA